MTEMWTVTEVTRYVKQLMEDDFVLPDVWIRGELSNFKRHSRGHMYFSVKDENSRIQAVMFAGHNRFLRFKPENGMNVLLRGEVNVYEPYGQYQFYAKEMQPDGIGSLHVAFEKLKSQLEEEGLFAVERKRRIPSLPQHIAIITSPTGAAIRDIRTTLKRRFPQARVTLLPALVQGDGAPVSVTQAIERASLAGVFDVLILGRGGGSIEELWAFNEEIVARAIADSRIPVISAVGHETDFTISDFVADVRAPTPTAAAELAVPDYRELIDQVGNLRRRMQRATVERVVGERKVLERLQRSYAFRYPEQLVRQKEQQLDGLFDRLKGSATRHLIDKRRRYKEVNKAITRQHPSTRLAQLREKLTQQEALLTRAASERVKEKKQHFSALLHSLNLLSPLNVMERGYSLAYKEEELLKSVAQVQQGDSLTINVSDGSIDCQVHSVRKSQAEKEEYT
ncbi:exodeoxyribonuclease VII large subunit [Shouchella shacheensis]|uniref:exodeoxyribonuclease VII large subunit n=1 Tax=Shouchella shacheensis TaxID=1649580 RepID=UPI0007403E09|nr:exodeoxyribonuclease VII large subunit [Shouchella shacheensis]